MRYLWLLLLIPSIVFAASGDKKVQVNTTDAQTLTNKTLTAPKVTTVEVDGTTNGTNLTAAQVSRTTISNYGQAASDVTLNLPLPAQGYAFMGIVGTARSNKWAFKSYSTSKINFDGTELNARQSVKVALPTLGNYLSCITYKSSSHASFPYQWLCRSGLGTWVSE